MNLILLHPEDFTGEGLVTLTGRRAQHIEQVLKASPGDTLKVGLLNGKYGGGVVQQIARRGGEATVAMAVSLASTPPAKLPLTLLLALPRPKATRRIIRAATELGVESIILVNSFRVEKSYWQSPLVDDAHLYQAMLEGLEQSGDTVLPRLRKAKLFKPFVEDELPGELQDRLGLVAHPYATATPPMVSEKKVLLAIGPEGGFIPYEIEKLLEAGMQGFHMGRRVLRTETAVPAIIASLFQHGGPLAKI